MSQVKMRTWLITDTHLGHDNIVKYCNRPPNHSEIILDNLKVIGKGDTLIHLGDFCIGRDKYWHKRFFERIPNTTRILVRGNHDKKSDNWYIRQGWSVVVKSFSNSYFGRYVQFSHKPLDNPQGLNFHGHLHNNIDPKELPNYSELHRLIALEHHYKSLLLNKLL